MCCCFSPLTDIYSCSYAVVAQSKMVVVVQTDVHTVMYLLIFLKNSVS